MMRNTGINAANDTPILNGFESKNSEEMDLDFLNVGSQSHQENTTKPQSLFSKKLTTFFNT